jgi:hypothetical protein
MDHSWQSAFTSDQMDFFDPFEDDIGVAEVAQQARAMAAAVVSGSGGDANVASSAVGGSCVGRRPNIERGFDEAVKRLNDDYFGPTPKYNDGLFARRFRMPRAVFDRIYTAVSTRPEFKRKTDALGKKGLHPLQRVLAALRMLAYGTAADAVDEYVRISESSALDSLRCFCQAVCDVFGEEYGRQPTESDLRRILSINEMRGFPGCLGSIDCQNWKWERCPIAFAGQFSGKEKKPTVVLEAIADAELWIWHAYFGCPGSLNDLNVLNMSTTMASVLQGKHPPRFKFVVDGKDYTTPYYLADGIYPSWAMFIKSLKNSTSPEILNFSSAQEAVRKDVERAFGVLIARFHVLKRPCLLRDRETMTKIMRACIIMHNMIVESRRDEYASRLYGEAAVLALGMSADEMAFEWQDQASLGMSEEEVGATQVGAWANSVSSRLAEFTGRPGHFALTKSLVRHIWARHGAGMERF